MKQLRIIKKYALRVPSKIYMVDGNTKKFKTLREFLNFSIDANGMFKPTYWDQACTKKQCHRARRSMPEIMKIVKTYYPEEVSEKDVLMELLTLRKSNGYGCNFPELRFCTDIKKNVFRYNYGWSSESKPYYYPDEISEKNWKPIIDSFEINEKMISDLQNTYFP